MKIKNFQDIKNLNVFENRKSNDFLVVKNHGGDF